MAESLQPATRSGKLPALPSLTGMRFIGLLMVWLFHVSFENIFSDGKFQMMPDPMHAPEKRGEIAGLFWQGGWVGLTFFFVLSGFVLTWSVRSGDTTRKFYRRRLVKIYPNNVLTYIAAFILVTQVGGTVITGRAAFLDLFLLQAWPEPRFAGGYVNATAWSLSCEVLFYLAFPLLMKLIRKIPRERLWAWTGGVLFVVLLVPLIAAALPPTNPAPWAQTNDLAFWFTFTFPPVRMLEFVFGMLMARIVITGVKLPFGLGGSLAIGVAAYAISPMLPLTYPLVSIMLLPVGLVMANTALLDVNKQKTFLASKPMIWLGELSFAFYLWHMMVLMYGHQLISKGAGFSTPVAILVALGMFAATQLLAWLTYVLVERPIMRRFASSRRRLQPVVAAAGADPLPDAEPGAGKAA
jgi:peptidoglycan/LPS O-acetylase OafA/YrhL